MISIFKDTITANKNWGIDQLSESEQFDVVLEQLKRARLELDEAEAALKHYQNGNAELPEVIEELADVCIFMQTATTALTGAPLDEMIKQKSAKVLERKGVMLGGSFVKEKDLKAVFGENCHSFKIGSGGSHRLTYSANNSEYPYSIDLYDAAEQVREWMASREL